MADQQQMELRRLVVLAGIGDDVDPYSLVRQRTITLRHLGSGREIVLKPVKDDSLQELLVLLRQHGPAQDGDIRPVADASPQYVPPEVAAAGTVTQVPQVPTEADLSFDVGGMDSSGVGTGADATSDF